MTNNVFKNYLYRFSNDECHSDFHLWACSTLIGALLGRRVWLKHGRFIINPTIYTALVGTAGSGKSSAKDVVRNIMLEHFPTYMLSSSIQSREDITNLMATSECERVFKVGLPPNNVRSYRPFFLVVNELAAFLSVDGRRMIDMLVDIYDTDHFSTGFKKDRALGIMQVITNPSMSMIGCVQPSWFLTNMKIDFFQGGLGRRMFIVYRDKSRLNDDPKFPLGSQPLWDQCIVHFKRLYEEKTAGEVQFNSAALAEWKLWYNDKSRLEKTGNPILDTFQDTEHIPVLKMCLILAFADYDFDYTIKPEHLKLAIHFLSKLKPDIERLTEGIGNNPMAGVASQMEQYIIVAGGIMPERRLYANFYRASPHGEKDYDEAVRYLSTTGHVRTWDHIVDSSVTRMIAMPAAWEKYLLDKKVTVIK